LDSSPDESYEKKRERYEQEKRDLLAKANALFERHPAYSKAEIQIYEKSNGLQAAEPLESLEKGSEARLVRTLKALDIRCEAYLQLVPDLEHLKAFRQKLNWFVWESWMYFCGFPLDMVPAPHPTTPLNEHQAKAKRFWDRSHHWYI